MRRAAPARKAIAKSKAFRRVISSDDDTDQEQEIKRQRLRRARLCGRSGDGGEDDESADTSSESSESSVPDESQHDEVADLLHDGGGWRTFEHPMAEPKANSAVTAADPPGSSIDDEGEEEEEEEEASQTLGSEDDGEVGSDQPHYHVSEDDLIGVQQFLLGRGCGVFWQRITDQYLAPLREFGQLGNKERPVIDAAAAAGTWQLVPTDEDDDQQHRQCWFCKCSKPVAFTVHANHTPLGSAGRCCGARFKLLCLVHKFLHRLLANQSLLPEPTLARVNDEYGHELRDLAKRMVELTEQLASYGPK